MARKCHGYLGGECVLDAADLEDVFLHLHLETLPVLQRLLQLLVQLLFTQNTHTW